MGKGGVAQPQVVDEGQVTRGVVVTCGFVFVLVGIYYGVIC